MHQIAPFIEFHDDPVKLHSGGRSHWLVRGDLIFADEELRESVLDEWVRCLDHSLGFREYIGIERGGVVWAQAIAERTNGRFYAMSVADLQSWGHLLLREDTGAGHPLIVVDDVTTTGASIELVPRADARLVVVDRRQPSGRTAVSAWATIPLPLLPD